jgi:LDH2 family malate/lactate/ureidoglycolate dehydrogenase
MADATGIDPDRLRTFIAALFRAAGVPPADAHLVADTLVEADLWGHQSHGVLRASWYLARLKSGVMQATPHLTYVTDAGALAVLDGGDSIGQVVATEAARSAVRRAKAHGIGVVSVRNSNHFGTAMYYTRMAAAEGCVAFLSTNASPSMPPWGGRRKLVGNNPWSIAAPAGPHPPMVLDIANTGVARGKIYLAKNRGEQIPLGWAIDADGRPTTDPAAAIAGNILPMAGHKGYAIALMMDVLSGVLSGSGFLDRVTGPYVADRRSGCGHLFIALDVAAFRPRAEFEADMERMIADIRATPLAPGVERLYYPGEIEIANAARHRRDGLALPADTCADLDTLRRAYAVEIDYRP